MKYTTIISAILGLTSMIPISVLGQTPTPEFKTASPDHRDERDRVTDTPINGETLEGQLVGHWVLEGTLAGKQTTHDFDAQWILNREYVQIHEVSREKKADGSPQYEAIIYVDWNEQRHEYSCLWLDSTEAANFRQLVIGYAKPEPNKIPFVFDYRKGETFHNTFTYDKKTDSWESVLEDHKDGKVELFGRVRLTRKG
jgi:hypothetical protein